MNGNDKNEDRNDEDEDGLKLINAKKINYQLHKKVDKRNLQNG